MIKGLARFDGIAIGEGSFSFLGTDHKLQGKAAFINSKNGQTHGWTTASGAWSKETLDKLQALRGSMERDIAAQHFTEVETGTNGFSPLQDADAPGLGEHLHPGGEVPQA